MKDDFFLNVLLTFLNVLLTALAMILGMVIGFSICANEVDRQFDGEYDKAKYEWKLNKGRQNDTTKN